MAVRSTTSQYLPSPPINRIVRGRVVARLGICYSAAHSHGVKPNMCVAPATNGERAFGKVAPSQPAWTKKQMKVTPHP